MQSPNGGAVAVIAQGIPVSYHDNSQLLVHSTQAAVTTTTQVEEAQSTTNHLHLNQSGSVVSSQDTDGVVDHDKKAIYRHPLFPLMALLFEKCEQATQTPDCPSSDSFDVDIQAFVQHQEQDRKPFFSDDPDLDGLMVKAIQVLRIHLLELEKVNDLCKDFCNRYISCLKGKLQSENLLRTDIPGFDCEPTSPTGLQQGMMSPGLGSPGGPNNVLQGNVAQPNVTALGQGQVVSGGTVYQMVQTDMGLVAQPIQIQTSPQLQQQQQQLGGQNSLIQGSTPLSQIGVQSANDQQGQHSIPNMSLLSKFDFPDDDMDGKKKSKRGVLPKLATQVMKSWLFQHIVHPYPTEEEKAVMCNQTNLSLLQVNNWFINARRRILQPMLDASNPEGSKAKKSKSTNRPVQRFWPENLANLQNMASMSKCSDSPDNSPTPSTPGSMSQSPTSTTTSSPTHCDGSGMMGAESAESDQGQCQQQGQSAQQPVLISSVAFTADGRVLPPPEGTTSVPGLGYLGNSMGSMVSIAGAGGNALLYPSVAPVISSSNSAPLAHQHHHPRGQDPAHLRHHRQDGDRQLHIDHRSESPTGLQD